MLMVKKIIITLTAALPCILLVPGGITGLASETENVSAFRVCIDPGHQGDWVDMSAQEPNAPGSDVMKAKATTGTQGSFTGVPEYQLNLDVSLKLRDELEKRGYEVVMTREDNDTAISNSERAVLAGEEGCDISVRIHANGSDDASVNGALVMTQSADNPYVGDLYQESHLLAEAVLEGYCAATGFADKGIQETDTMTGINWSSVPVMILEMGFMTNEADDRAMQESSMQLKMASGIADGIDRYVDETRPKAEESSEDVTEETSEEGYEEVTESMTEKIKTALARVERPLAGAAVYLEDILAELTEKQEDRAEMENLVNEIYDQFLSSRESQGEEWAVSIQSLSDDVSAGYNESSVMQSASVLKVFIMGAVYEYILDPQSEEERISYGESYEGELNDLLTSMITVSSNEAANSLVRILGNGDTAAGQQVLSRFCEKHGYEGVSMGRMFLESDPTGDNYVTADACRMILSDIYHGKLVNEEDSRRMLELLKNQTVRTKIPSGLSEGFTSANKTGEMPEGYGLGCIENDIAIIFGPEKDFVLCVLSNELGGRNSEAQAVIQQIAGYAAGHLM